MANVFNIGGLADQFKAARDKAGNLAREFVGDTFAGQVIPALPFFFPDSPPHASGAAGGYKEAEAIEDAGDDPASMTIFGTPMCFPLSIKRQSEGEDAFWLLPVEPIINISGGNVLTRRYVAKSDSNLGRRLRGSIKERWATDDYTINIAGLLTKWDEWRYPKDDVAKLRQMLESREPLDVKSPLLTDVLGITRIVVERWDFPFTKGPENQNYTISAFSDDDWELLIPLA